MDRVLATLLASAALAGCAPAAPKRLVGGDVVLSSVSSDQQWVAALGSPTLLPTGAHVGALELVPASGAAPTPLDPSSSGGTFARGTALWYLGGVRVVTEGTPPSDHVYGALYVWTPALGAPVKVGDDVREYQVSQDGSACVFMDWAMQTIDPANTGTLKAVRASSCAAGGCDVLDLADGIPLAQADWRISDDGLRVFATIRGAAAGDPGAAALATLDSGQIAVLSTAMAVRSAMMTPAGDTVAWVERQNEIHVTPTAGGAVTVLTAGSPIVDGASMIDAGDFVAKVRDTATDPAALALVSAAGTTPLPVDKPLQFFVSQAVPGRSTRYVFFQLATIAANGEPDLWMLDLGTPDAQPVKLGDAVEDPIADAVAFSDDGSAIEYADNFDPVTRRGDEYVVPLAKPARTLVASRLRLAAYLPGTTQLLYIDAPDPTTGAGVLTVLPSPTALTDVQNVGIVNFADSRQPPARTWFTEKTGAPDDGIWSMPQP